MAKKAYCKQPSCPILVWCPAPSPIFPGAAADIKIKALKPRADPRCRLTRNMVEQNGLFPHKRIDMRFVKIEPPKRTFVKKWLYHLKTAPPYFKLHFMPTDVFEICRAFRPSWLEKKLNKACWSSPLIQPAAFSGCFAFKSICCKFHRGTNKKQKEKPKAAVPLFLSTVEWNLSLHTHTAANNSVFSFSS